MPARIVVHKTSTFSPEEAEGFTQATKDNGLESCDLVSMARSTTRLFRRGAYLPLRGTVWITDEGPHFVYTRGSIEFYSAYPGLYVPRPLQYQIELGDSTPKRVGKEMLELTKMNWNTAQFDNAEPITLRAARQVGSILRYTENHWAIEHRYSFYM